MQNLSDFRTDVTPEQEALLEVVDQACSEIRPYEDRCWLEHRFNDKVVDVFGRYDLLSLPIAEDVGGQAIDPVTWSLAIERIGEEGCSLRTFFSGHVSIGQMTFDEFGSEHIRSTYLPPATTGEHIMAFGLTEPTAGSDPASLKTTFEETNDGFVLNGSKSWISNATIASVVHVYARDKHDPDRISAFVLETDQEGVQQIAEKHKMGLNSSDTGSIFMDDVVVEKEHLLGTRGRGLSHALATIMNGRLSVAAGCVGVIKDCRHEASEYAKQRVQHGKEIARHQLVQRHIGLMSLYYETSRLLVMQAADMKRRYAEDKTNVTKRKAADAAIVKAKYYAANYGFEAADRAVQVFGGNGYSLENRPGRHLCDTRVCRIYEGSNEILEQRMALDHMGVEWAAFR